jgi:hypothetical protein
VEVFAWKAAAGAEGDVTDRACMLGRVLETTLNAPGFMAFELGSRLMSVGRMSAKPFWKEVVLDVWASD